VAEIAKTLKARMGAAAKRVPTREFPDFIIRIASWFDPAVKLIVPELGKRKNASGEKAQRVLGWNPRTREDAVVATAELRKNLEHDPAQMTSASIG
jgi:nucleoside-diphosphate-sugar epimerase